MSDWEFAREYTDKVLSNEGSPIHTAVYKKTLDNGEFLLVWDEPDDDVWGWERWVSGTAYILVPSDGDLDVAISDCLGYGYGDTLEDAQTDAENDCRSVIESHAEQCVRTPERFEG